MVPSDVQHSNARASYESVDFGAIALCHSVLA